MTEPVPARSSHNKSRFSFIAVVIALTIAGLNLTFWAFTNRPAKLVDWDGRIKGFAYNGFQRYQSPLKRIYPNEDEIRNDLSILAEYTRRIRVYAAAENEALPRLADEEGLHVAVGAWLSRDEENNEAEITALMRAARNNKNVDSLIVGNETILRGDLQVADLIKHLKRVRSTKPGVPVTTAEPWHVWLKYPELVKNVDFITVHLLPYWEGVPIEAAVDHVFKRYDELKRTYPKKRVVIGEVGWPSNGDRIKEAEASTTNAARFIREFLDRTLERPVDYYLMEAFDQPWKIEDEGRAGGYWGVFDAYREEKYPLQGSVEGDPLWREKAIGASLLALLPMIWFATAFRRFRFAGKVFFCGLIQAAVTLAVWLIGVPFQFYLSPVDWAMLGLLIPALIGMMLILLTNGFEFTEAIWARKWLREFLPRQDGEHAPQPFVSIHLPCYNEPPEMVMLTLDSLARLDYENFEVLVIDNNTKDEATWKPVEDYVSRLGARFRFFHLDNWPGFKAGALNFALGETDARAEVIGVVDADYVVSRDWLKSMVGYFEDAKVAVVQAPQAHRDFQHSFFQRMCNWEFDGFFRIGMHHRNERNAIIQHGTMTLVRRVALVDTGKWSEWCICEDAELGLRLMHAGYETKYVDAELGHGLTPSDFKAFKSQRFRWAFGAMQILKRHWGALTGRSPLSGGQRYHFLTGWFSWFADALHLVFTLLSIGWTAGMVLDPARFTLPLDLFLVPVLGFFVAKAFFGPVLYAVRVRCGWRDIVGASLASLALSHVIAQGVLNGLWAKRGVFVRTAKGAQRRSLLKAFDVVREEAMLLVALGLAILAMLQSMGPGHREAMLWVTILAAQSLPYLATLTVAFVSARTAAAPRQVPRTAAPAAEATPLPAPALAAAATGS